MADLRALLPSSAEGNLISNSKYLWNANTNTRNMRQREHLPILVPDHACLGISVSLGLNLATLTPDVGEARIINFAN